MNDAKIATLLAKRNRLLTRRDGLYDSAVISRIDAQLATVEPGRDNRVDLALGRMCAVLERYAPPLSAAEIADMEARTAETATEPPTYDGMWM